MPILNIVTQQIGLVGVNPKWIYISTTDTIAQVTTTGYLNEAVSQGFTFNVSDMALVSTVATPGAAPTVNILEISHVGTDWSLVSSSGPGSVTLPTIANHLMVSTNTTGALANLTGTAINAGSLQAGLSGIASGTLISLPAAANNGSLIVAAVNAGGAFNTTISNATMGQSTVYTIPDIGATTGNIVVSTATVRMKSVGAAVAAGGAAAQSFSEQFCTTGSVVIGNWVSQTTPGEVIKIVPGNGSFVVTSTTDVGSGTFSYVVMK